MARPWQTLARADSNAGTLELRRRGDDDFLITIDGRILMNSRAERSELALAELGCEHVRRSSGTGGTVGARILVGGLGMGITLRAVLDLVAGDARIVVAELNPIVAEWCSGPLAAINGAALDDPRVSLQIADVADLIAKSHEKFDAILLDLYEGPHADSDPIYSSPALERMHARLRPGGVLAVWGEQRNAGFEARMRAAGFAAQSSRPGRGGLRHVVYRGVRS